MYKSVFKNDKIKKRSEIIKKRHDYLLRLLLKKI
jgi:hypothetical protein